MKNNINSFEHLPTVNPTLDLREVVTIYLKLYDSHWNRRIMLFSFFLTIEVILFGAFCYLKFGFSNIENERSLMLIIGTCISIVSIIIFAVDNKIKLLLNFTCVALRKFEEIYESEFPPEMRLVSTINNSVSNPDLTVLFWICYGFTFLSGLLIIILTII